MKDKSEDTTGYCYEISYLRDSVDIIVFALTTIEGNSDNGIYSIGYGVNPVKQGDSIPFRKMLEMRDTISVADSLKYYLTYADSLCAHFYNFYIVTNCSMSAPQPGYGLSNIKEDCWSTNINEAGTANADSIEDARFPDGYYVTTIKVWAHSGDSAVAVDTILVDNFNPKVKETRPTDWFAFVPTKEKRVWCRFSEAMDTTTLNSTNTKIQSLKADSFDYTITNFIYDDSIYKLTLEVDSFRFKDTVQVRLLDGVKDLAGKSIDTTGSEQTIAYSWTFVVGVMQITDNDVDDILPDVYHGDIVWTQGPIDNGQGEIMFYDFYDDTIYQISPGGGIHNTPYIYEDKVAWVGYGWGYTNPVYYYDGTTSKQIASANRGRYSMEISEGGVVWRSYYGDLYPDTIWIEYYDPDSDQVFTLDMFLDYEGRYVGRTDIDGNEIVWDQDAYPQIEREIYYYCDGDTHNFSSDTSHIDGTPDISHSQIAWLKENGVAEVWLYDGTNKRKIASIEDYEPHLHNGSIVWIKGTSMHTSWDLKFFDGRDTLVLANHESGWFYWAFQCLGIHNNQITWLRLAREFYEGPYRYAYYNASYYDGEQVLDFTDDTLSDTYRIEVHDGFVVFDALDGYDYEVYLYIGDTLFTPPGIVRNADGEIIEQKASEKQVKLTWSANSESDLAGYCVYRSDSSYKYDTIPYDSVSAPDTTFTDTLPMDGWNYYVITAYDSAGNEGGFSNQVEVFIDVYPPSVPYITKADKSGSNFVLTWHRITTDTVGNPESMDYYVVYRNTSPSFVPGSADSIGYVSHPDTTYTDVGALDSVQSYYYLVKAVDSTDNRSKRSNMGYKFNKFVNENTGATADRNWVSLPYISEYDSIKDLTDDVSPSGDPISKITRLDVEEQSYYSWIYHSILGWYGNHPTIPNFPIVLGTAYEMIVVADDTVIFVGANNPDGLVSLNENPGSTSDRNWISMPYNAAYDSVKDITDDLSPSGEPVSKITMLDEESQLFYSWIYHSVLGWYGNHPTTKNFPIKPGTGYEFIATKDTTWNPIEWSNEEQGLFIVEPPTQKPNVYMYAGTSPQPTRAPVWVTNASGNESWNEMMKNTTNYFINIYKTMTATSKSTTTADHRENNICVSTTGTYKSEGTGEQRGNAEDERRISHIVWTHFDEAGFENIVFTTYRLSNPYDVLTEQSVSCVTANYGSSYHLISFDVGNFKKPWKEGEEAVLIVEATKNGKPHYDIIDYKLDDGVDIQELREIELKPFTTIVSGESRVYWNMTDSDMIVGYSLYQNGGRLNEKILTKSGYSIQDDVDLKLVIVGGHETVYGSKGIQSSPKESVPISYTFDLKPNPFMKQTQLDYALPNQASVEIVIYDVAGRKVKTLISEIHSSGYYSTTWNGVDDKGRRIPSGVYFIRFEAGEFRTQDKILLVK